MSKESNYLYAVERISEVDIQEEGLEAKQVAGIFSSYQNALDFVSDEMSDTEFKEAFGEHEYIISTHTLDRFLGQKAEESTFKTYTPVEEQEWNN